MKSLPSDIKSPWHFEIVVWAAYWTQTTEILIQKTSAILWQLKKGSEIIDMIRLDMPKVLFVSKEIGDSVVG